MSVTSALIRWRSSDQGTSRLARAGALVDELPHETVGQRADRHPDVMRAGAGTQPAL